MVCLLEEPRWLGRLLRRPLSCCMSQLQQCDETLPTSPYRCCVVIRTARVCALPGMNSVGISPMSIRAPLFLNPWRLRSRCAGASQLAHSITEL